MVRAFLSWCSSVSCDALLVNSMRYGARPDVFRSDKYLNLGDLKKKSLHPLNLKADCWNHRIPQRQILWNVVLGRFCSTTVLLPAATFSHSDDVIMSRFDKRTLCDLHNNPCRQGIFFGHGSTRTWRTPAVLSTAPSAVPASSLCAVQLFCGGANPHLWAPRPVHRSNSPLFQMSAGGAHGRPLHTLHTDQVRAMRGEPVYWAMELPAQVFVLQQPLRWQPRSGEGVLGHQQ